MQDLRKVVMDEITDKHFCAPMPIESLTGEVPVSIVGSRTHALAITKGGDVFTWGSPESAEVSIASVVGAVFVYHCVLLFGTQACWGLARVTSMWRRLR